MNVQQVVQKLQEMGITLRLKGGTLQATPARRLDRFNRALIRLHHQNLIAYLQQQAKDAESFEDIEPVAGVMPNRV
jgi:primosomal protein N''